MNRPGDPSRFNSAFMESSRTGTCWYSSMNTGPLPETNKPGIVNDRRAHRRIVEVHHATAVPTCQYPQERGLADRARTLEQHDRRLGHAANGDFLQAAIDQLHMTRHLYRESLYHSTVKFMVLLPGNLWMTHRDF